MQVNNLMEIKMTIFLETSRLLLNAPTLEDDVHLIINLRSDPEVMRYMGDGNTQNEAQTYEFLTQAISYYNQYKMGICSVFEKKSNKFMGQAGLMHLGFNTNNEEIEISYRLDKQFWGNGYATEIVSCLVAWGFANLSVDQLIAITYPANIASQRVLTKSGFKYKEKIYWFGNTELLKFNIYSKLISSREINMKGSVNE